MPQIYQMYITLPTTSRTQLEQYRDGELDDRDGSELYSDDYHEMMDDCSQQLIRTTGYIDSDREVNAVGSGRYHHADLIRKLLEVQV